jgi:hypothetical protein
MMDFGITDEFPVEVGYTTPRSASDTKAEY